ncbi:MAG: hypothetical protein U5K38_07410 [Woeseiaceae bacterium]|nr:hypothetical protein [Woeseiaceae bacterium]
MTRYFDPLVEALPGCAAPRTARLPGGRPVLELPLPVRCALTLTFADTGRIDNLSDGLCKSSDMEAANARMPRFVAAGFRALCGPPADEP